METIIDTTSVLVLNVNKDFYEEYKQTYYKIGRKIEDQNTLLFTQAITKWMTEELKKLESKK